MFETALGKATVEGYADWLLRHRPVPHENQMILLLGVDTNDFHIGQRIDYLHPAAEPPPP